MKAKTKKPEVIFDYKNPEFLKRYLTETGSIVNKEKSGLTAKQQRDLARAVKRARHLALLPFVTTL